jgi:hypothetical protein
MNLRGRPLLWLLGAIVVASVLVVRATSTFAAVTRRASEAEALAARVGLLPEEVMALLDLAPELGAEALALRATRVQTERVRLGDLGLAVAVVHGQAALVEAAVAASNGDLARARQRVQAAPEGLVVTRFLSMVDRYRAWAERER